MTLKYLGPPLPLSRTLDLYDLQYDKSCILQTYTVILAGYTSLVSKHIPPLDSYSKTSRSHFLKM